MHGDSPRGKTPPCPYALACPAAFTDSTAFAIVTLFTQTFRRQARTGGRAGGGGGFGGGGFGAAQFSLARLQIGLHQPSHKAEEIRVQQMHVLNLCAQARQIVRSLSKDLCHVKWLDGRAGLYLPRCKTAPGTWGLEIHFKSIVESIRKQAIVLDFSCTTKMRRDDSQTGQVIELSPAAPDNAV